MSKISVKLRRYGVFKTQLNSKGKFTLVPYISNDCTDSRPDRFPEKVGGEVIKECIEWLSAEDAERKANEMLSNLECPVLSISIGDIAHHSDCQGTHQAVILGIQGDMVQAIFFTSSPMFGVRRAQIEELGCAGFGYSRDTYLAPVERPIREFVSEGKKFPDYRVQELLAEFFG
jgi:hypothetical protein